MILPDIKFNVGEYFAYKNELYKVVEMIEGVRSPFQWAKCFNVELGTMEELPLTTKCFKLEAKEIRDCVEYHLEKMEEKAARLKNALNEVGG